MNYDIDNPTNRYDSVGGNPLAYDAAGNLTTDKDGYQYEYDYENRITKIIKSGPTTVAEFAYDALGRRIKKRDSIANTNNIYYYNDNWQILCDYNDTGAGGTPERWFAYGNYIDEAVLMSKSFTSWLSARYYIQDHLYSPAALMGATGAAPIERYEYDAYGNCYVLEPNLAPDPDNKTDYGNPYAFQGKHLNLLDGGELQVMHWPCRDYSTYLGRWLEPEKLGMIPNDDDTRNPFSPLSQHADGVSLYEGLASQPVGNLDPYGLWNEDTHLTRTIRWAQDVGYHIRCARIIGNACQHVDSIASHTGPYPWKGDMSYHFDTDPLGNYIVLGAMLTHFRRHLAEAETLIKNSATWGRTTMALGQLGTALHPLQDTFSHYGFTTGHKAALPMLHAPRVYCTAVFGDPHGTLRPFCITQRTTNKNWDDPHLPDYASKWPLDLNKTGVATKNVLEGFLKHPCIQCFCQESFEM